MHKATTVSAAGTPTSQNAAPFFSTLFRNTSSNVSLPSDANTTTATPLTTNTSAPSRPRPATSAGESSIGQTPSQPPSQLLPPPPPVPLPTDRHRPNVLTKERRPSLNKKPSFTRRRGSTSSGSGGAVAGFLFQQHQHRKSSSSIGGGGGSASSPKVADNSNNGVSSSTESGINATTQPPLPIDWVAATASAARRDSPNPENIAGGNSTATPILASTTNTPNFSHPSAIKMINTAFGTNNTGLGITLSGASAGSVSSVASEVSALHLHMQETANKRISTLDYLRKAHEGRVYWFNTLRFDRPDLARMSYFDSRRLARRATNYLLLGLSLPAVVDLNSTSAIDLLRSLSALLAEFETFQQLHSESGSGSTASSLSRAARLPNMFRRATPGSKVRRTSSSAASGSNDFGMPGGSFDGSMGGGGGAGGGGASAGGILPSSGTSGSAGADSIGGSALTLVNSESAGSVSGVGVGGSFGNNASVGGVPQLGAVSSVASTAFATYYDNNADLLPGEEYAFLLTPSLPFDPDFFETFATLCDVLIDCYTRILSLVPTPRDCSPLVVELFGKADARVRKLLVQSVVKEFEDHSRGGVKMEVANVGKVVLGGLM